MESFDKIASDYFRALREAYSNGYTESTEQMGRTALHNFLTECAPLFSKSIKIEHEPKQIKSDDNERKRSAPDFQVKRKGRVIGYVETKIPGTNYQKTANSEQIKKYQSINKNILITNYHEFYSPVMKQNVVCCHQNDLYEKSGQISLKNLDELEKILYQFFTTGSEKISRVKTLSEELAKRCRYLKDELYRSLLEQKNDKRKQGALYGIYAEFKNQISSKTKLTDFSDAIAQTLGYGTLLARLNAKENEDITLGNARTFIPDSFSLIAELIKFLDELENEMYGNIRWIVEEILSVINNLDLYEIKRDLNFFNPSQKRLSLPDQEWELYKRDPFVYFYENFLIAYNKKQRKQRGVYCTPPPIVNFIVRGIDDMLKDKIKLSTGLADYRVTALDFACGTGTFLLETMRQIFDNTNESLAREILDEHICKHIFGFELLIAAYTVAHIKLSQYLADKNIPLMPNQRLPVYLANTLENFDIQEQFKQKNLLLTKLSKEGEEAQKIKEKDILVIMGNPPYSGHSMNKNSAIDQYIKDYTKNCPELQKPGQGKWLMDDYVKFIKFAQNKMDSVEEGIVGIITNHSFIDKWTFRGMRQSLMTTFDQIYILDLHGNIRKKIETSSDELDENVFLIKQGVAISFFIKNRKLEKEINYCGIKGSRDKKYRLALTSSYKDIEWEKINPESPHYFFVPTNRIPSYDNDFWSLPEIFACNGDPAPGIVTTHDQFAISFNEEEVTEKIHDLLNSSDEKEAHQKFRLCSQSQWNYQKAKEALKDMKWKKQIVPIAYRPFDTRRTVYNSHVAVHRRTRVMQHMLEDNLGLITCRHRSFGKWCNIFVTKNIIDYHFSSHGDYLFPLYLYPPEKGKKIPKVTSELLNLPNPFENKEKIENINPKFRDWINSKYGKTIDAEKIFFYIYAILHCPFYRDRYSEFLCIDFPRIPFPDNKLHFLALVKLGEKLKELHLLERLPKNDVEYKGKCDGKDNHVVTEIRFVEPKLYINSKQYFAPVDKETWNFHIGSYQVLDKYLKERKGRKRKLSLEEFFNIEGAIVAIDETRKLMVEIDLVARSFL